MFQNIASGVNKNNRSQDVKFDGEEIKDILKKLFSIRNIIIYVFLRSICSKTSYSSK